MEIAKSFLEPEVRDGFYVPSEVKQAWAAEMKVLQEIDRICRKHNIAYFADWGTLLGAVRHGGFIPWDDDLDITMTRPDYERFLQVAKAEMKEGFSLFTYETHPNFWSFMARFVAKKRICFEEDHLNEFYGFPYIVGIDIFVMDYVSTDDTQNKERAQLARYVIESADIIFEGNLNSHEISTILDKLEVILSVKFYNRTDLHALRVQMYRIAETLFAKFSPEESKELTRMMPNELYKDRKLRLSKEYYNQQIWLPFENIQIPVPSGYDEMLRKRYGNYMQLVRNAGGHDYPFFEAQKKQLQSVLDFEIPGYKYSGIMQRDTQSDGSNSLKHLVQEVYQQLEHNYHLLKVQAELDFEVLLECQQLAIDIGTLIEQCKGNDHPVVHLLENYCEIIYQLSTNSSKEPLRQIELLLTDLKSSIQDEILARKEVVFILSKASQWEYIASVYQAVSADKQYDIFVIPVPYYYKNFDGTFCDEHYEADLFMKNIPLTRYNEFDFGLHYPEIIFIQSPYDEFNPVISVHSFFYSTNLKQYTQELIYIPPFVLEEFTKNSYREYHNMQYYCTMPGVINADKVIVQSENMKHLYVEKLTEFAGENTRFIWEEKIKGRVSPKHDILNAHDAISKGIPEEWLPLIEKADGTKKKIIMYYTGLSSFMQYKKEALDKIRRTFDTFQKRHNDVLILWKPHSLIKTTLEQSDSLLYREYCLLEDEFVKNAYGVLDGSLDNETTAILCDAYYGDTSPLAQLFRNSGKPVLIQDVQI